MTRRKKGSSKVDEATKFNDVYLTSEGLLTRDGLDKLSCELLGSKVQREFKLYGFDFSARGDILETGSRGPTTDHSTG